MKLSGNAGPPSRNNIRKDYTNVVHVHDPQHPASAFPHQKKVNGCGWKNELQIATTAVFPAERPAYQSFRGAE